MRMRHIEFVAERSPIAFNIDGSTDRQRSPSSQALDRVECP
jgi:hypothetical protein